MKNFLISVLLVLCSSVAVVSQTFDFNVYNSSIGLPQNYIYSIEQDRNGFIWIATAEGVSRYDGVSFVNFSDKDSLADNFTRSIYISQTDGRVILGHNNGSFSIYKNNRFTKLIVDDALSPIRGITATPNGTLWAVEQNNGLLKIDNNDKVTIFFDRKKFGPLIYTAVQYIAPATLLVGTTDGLYEVKLNERDEPESMLPIDDTPLTVINSITQRLSSDDEFWVGTEDEGFFKYNSATGKAFYYSDDVSCVEQKLSTENVQMIREDNDGCLYIATWGRGVVKLYYNTSNDSFDYSQTFDQENGMVNNYAKDILIDRESNIWFATYGGGVVSLVNGYFMFYNFEEIGLKHTHAHTVLKCQTGLWAGIDMGLLHADPNCFTDHEYYDKAQGLPDDAVSSISYGNGTLWVGTASHGLYKKADNQMNFVPVRYTFSIPGLKINSIITDNDNVYIATQGGFFIYDIKTGGVESYNTENGLPHNSINFVHIDKQKQLWLGPKDSGITLFKRSSFEIHRLSDSPVNVSDMTQDAEGRYWLSTYSRGILCYSLDTVINYTVQDGLEKNYCYSIECDSRNRIWVAHQPGASCYDVDNEVFRKFGVSSQLNSGIHHFYKDDDDDIWFATSQGIVKYNPYSDRENQYPPLLNFVNIDISGQTYSADSRIVLPYRYNKRPYMLNIDFVGISFKDPDNVQYEYCLTRGIGVEDEWISLKNVGHKEFDYLSDGSYTFKVRGYNSDGVMSLSPLVLNFKIESPIWKKGWFYIMVAALFILFILFLINYRERRLKEQKKILETEVANQTVKLRRQKAEIEQKNRDITDSINYAKRIQKSILPPLVNLQSTFKESFIFFQPRDIVSGDFYWFNRNGDRAIICCADCTGHGVPGAFMSMIGTTILNDIFRLPEIDSPASLLERLDKEMKIMLHRNHDMDTNDGMDIAVVEINLSTRIIRVASAKRPVYLYVDKEFIEYKGNRRSIGDKSTNQDNNPFNNIVYKGHKGDLVYLFSDGYSDQFGGPNGKKLMTTGVKGLLANIVHIPVKEQGVMVANHFKDWRGEFDQIDDVLFMGVKIP